MDPGTPRRPGYLAVGFARGDFGLAVAGRNALHALRSSGRQVVRLPLDEATRPAMPTGDEVALFQLNPLEIARTFDSWREVAIPGRKAVCAPFWELPQLPRSWLPMLGAMDAVLAPSRFIEDACRAALPGLPVLPFPQAVFLPEGIRPDREAWGIPADVTAFLLSFDVGSDIARKNPRAAIEAFRRAFALDDEVRLVLKTRPWAEDREHSRRLALLRSEIAGDPRVVVVERSLPYRDLLSLYASCDALVALHRSEGLGLHLMEAMSLGKVVVATGWSGNADFMDARNSIPVDFRLVPVRSTQSEYLPEVGRPGQVWADPDVDAAARALRAIHVDRELRRTLGEAARRDMEARRSGMTDGSTFTALEAVLDARPARSGLVRGVDRTRPFLRRAWLRDHARWVMRRMGLGRGDA